MRVGTRPIYGSHDQPFSRLGFYKIQSGQGGGVSGEGELVGSTVVFGPWSGSMGHYPNATSQDLACVGHVIAFALAFERGPPDPPSTAPMHKFSRSIAHSCRRSHRSAPPRSLSGPHHLDLLQRRRVEAAGRGVRWPCHHHDDRASQRVVRHRLRCAVNGRRLRDHHRWQRHCTLATNPVAHAPFFPAY